MKNIQIDGTNTLNKGAELMLYAILEQIECRYPNAVVFYNFNEVGESHSIDTKHKLRKRWGLRFGRYPAAVLRRLHLPHTYFTAQHAKGGLDLVLDGAGFQFSDQWNYSTDRLDKLENYYRRLKRKGTKIVLLPQAFGPFRTDSGKRIVEIISRYVDIIIARERISYNYLVEAGAAEEKIWLYPDFTSLVKGTFPNRFNTLRDRVCIIPNRKMVTHASSNMEQYLNFLKQIILAIEEGGKQVFLLNHEGRGDLTFCNEINERLNGKYTVATGLNAKEVKGLIGASSLVISSRFHGVASALNQGVPCLATSWNHKYEMLFEDFGQQGNILQVGAPWNETHVKLTNILSAHDKIQRALIVEKEKLSLQTEKMWDRIWQRVTSK